MNYRLRISAAHQKEIQEFVLDKLIPEILAFTEDIGMEMMTDQHPDLILDFEENEELILDIEVDFYTSIISRIISTVKREI